MKGIKKFSQIFFNFNSLNFFKTSINNDLPIKNAEENIKEKNNSEKEKIEVKFSCDEDGISKYLDDGWIILKEDSQEKICTWKSVPSTKDCDIEKDKGCKLKNQIK